MLSTDKVIKAEKKLLHFCSALEINFLEEVEKKRELASKKVFFSTFYMLLCQSSLH